MAGDRKPKGAMLFRCNSRFIIGNSYAVSGGREGTGGRNDKTAEEQEEGNERKIMEDRE